MQRRASAGAARVPTSTCRNDDENGQRNEPRIHLETIAPRGIDVKRDQLVRMAVSGDTREARTAGKYGGQDGRRQDNGGDRENVVAS